MSKKLMGHFFFDTANEEYIRNLWYKEGLKDYVNPMAVRGITTNPNAFKKMEMFKLEEWETQLVKLCKLVTEIRSSIESPLNIMKGVVYVQVPNCDMRVEEMLHFAEHISKFNDGTTKLGLKLPPYLEVLLHIEEFNAIMETNITGVADAGTALYAASFPVRYVSLIPGRMEEVGIDADAHMGYIQASNNFIPFPMGSAEHFTELITGSMRTLEGLKKAFEYGTVPTIGERVWNLMLEDSFDMNELDKFNDLDFEYHPTTFCPHIDERNTELSSSFFEQMNECGSQARSDFDWINKENVLYKK